MTTTMEYVLREVRRTDTYNLALDAYYFSKGLAVSTEKAVVEHIDQMRASYYYTLLFP